MKTIQEQNNEYILCSAIWFDDGKEYLYQPKNIKTGFVICGRRHHNCYATLSAIVKNDDTIQNHLQYEKIQGFLTNKDQFVDRRDATVVAFLANQIEEMKYELFSEDLW